MISSALIEESFAVSTTAALTCIRIREANEGDTLTINFFCLSQKKLFSLILCPDMSIWNKIAFNSSSRRKLSITTTPGGNDDSADMVAFGWDGKR